MKEQIMEKLFNSKELTTEEILFIGKNLHESSHNALQFDHAKQDTLEACGVSKQDFEALNKILEETIESRKKEFKGMSEYIEKFEDVVLVSPKHLRMFLLNYVRLMFESQHPLGRLLGLMGRL